MKPNILIGVPCARDTIFVETARVLTDICLYLQRGGATFSLKYLIGSPTPQARNYYASRVLHESFTHLLFVDSDMICRPEAVHRLISADKDIIGLACPARRIDLDRVLSLDPTIGRDAAVARASSWCFVPLNELAAIKGIAQIKRIGMGVTLIKRNVIESLSRSNLISRRTHHFADLDSPLLGFFDPLIEPEHLSEDFSFCDRWSALGGSIFMVTDEVVGHIGSFTYSAKLDDIRATAAAYTAR